MYAKHIAYTKYISTFVVSEETTEQKKETNEKKKTKMKTTTVKAYTVSTNYSSAQVFARNKKEARDMFRRQYLQGCDYKDSEINVQ